MGTTSVSRSNTAVDKFESVIEEISAIARWNDPKGVYAILPYNLEAN